MVYMNVRIAHTMVFVISNKQTRLKKRMLFNMTSQYSIQMFDKNFFIKYRTRKSIKATETCYISCGALAETISSNGSFICIIPQTG